MPPKKNRSQVFTGEVGRICPQSDPAWLLIAEKFIPEYLAGKTTFSPSDFNSSSSMSGVPAQDPRSTEDCLFLDVLVPKKIFDKRQGNKKSKGAPVLVWIYGGGYTAGSKEGSGDPAGLILRSQNNNSDGVIYVSMNYRLGAFGFLAGPTFQQDGTANAGLYDQRLALEWVQQNIHLFGGDPDRVTVFGESAGGGSIMQQITAFGGTKGKSPFQQAIPQSPGIQVMPSTVQQEMAFNNYLTLLNVSTIEQARSLSYEKLQLANILQVGLQSTYGTFTYGPVVDGIFSPSLPGQLLARGQFDKSVKVMVGHNTNEGLLFTSPFLSNDSDVKNFFESLLPSIKAFPAAEDYLLNTLYPPIFDGSQAQNYTDQIGRASAAVAEVTFTCNAYYLDKAYQNHTYAYLFAIPPGIHGEDIPYTYFNGPNKAEVVSDPTAIALQEYITHFAEYGTPNEQGVPYFPMYQNNATVQVLNVTGIRQTMDPAANARCDWWQKALFY